MAGQIYPTDLPLNKTNSFDTEAPFLVLDLASMNGMLNLKFMIKIIISGLILVFK